MKAEKKKGRIVLSILITLILALSFSVCTSPIKAKAAKRVSISNKTVKLYVGKTKTIKLKNVTKKQAKTIKWTTSKKTVATVSKSGKITAKKAGKATITAKYKKKKYTCKVTVIKKPVTANTSITLEKENLVLGTDDTATVLIKTNYGKPIEVSASNANVFVELGDWSGTSREMKITGINSGSSIVTIKDATNTSVKATLYVTVTNISNTYINVEEKDITIGVGESKTILVFTDKGKSLSAQRSNTNIATSWGSWIGTSVPITIKGQTPGTTKLTIVDANISSVKVEINITVYLPEGSTNTMISVDKPEIELNVGETAQVLVTTDKGKNLTASRSGSSASFTWGNYTGLTANMTIKGVSGGTTVITISDQYDPSVTAQITVKVNVPVTGIKFTTEDYTVMSGETQKLYYNVTPYNTTSEIKWRSSDPSVAIVDDSGENVIGVGSGHATLTAYADNGVSATCNVTVKDINISLPTLPQSVNYYSGTIIKNTCKVTDITLEKSYYSYDDHFSVKIHFSGEKTYDTSPSISSACKIGYKIYDTQNNVVKSGVFTSEAVAVGETFKGYTYVSSLAEGDYRLELLGVK